MKTDAQRCFSGEVIIAFVREDHEELIYSPCIRKTVLYRILQSRLERAENVSVRRLKTCDRHPNRLGRCALWRAGLPSPAGVPGFAGTFMRTHSMMTWILRSRSRGSCK